MVSLPGHLQAQDVEGHTASHLVVLELVACINLVLYHTRLAFNGYMLWLMGCVLQQRCCPTTILFPWRSCQLASV